jgi:PAS domain S-box-containing protein
VRLFAKYAAISLIPVLVLGAVLAVSFRNEARARGLDEGKAEAMLVRRTAIEPIFDGSRPLRGGVTRAERAALDRLIRHGRPGDILRLRIRDMSGQVVYSDDHTGLRHTKPEDEVLDALHGRTAASLRRLNSDNNDEGPTGKPAVEVYEPLTGTAGHRVIGVIELYLPYTPIAAAITTGLDNLYVELAVGLALLYVALAAITASSSSGLRRQLRVNARQAVRLREGEQRYRLLFERNPQPMFAYERSTLRIVAVSNAAVRSYGYSAEEFLELTVFDLVPEQDHDATRAFIDGALAPANAGLVLARPWRHRRKDGSVFEVEVTSDDVVLGDRDCRIALCLDVTERNRAAAEIAAARDAAVEASRMKSAFLANMSHEIRTPMNGVIGCNELLLGTGLSAEQRGYAEQVARSGEQMLALLNDILDVSRIEAGRLELDPEDIDLRATVQQACAIAEMQARSKGLRFAMEIEPDVPETVHADGGRLRQVLLNLASNAVKFTAIGSVRVRVLTAAAARVRFEVTDTGIGVDPAILDRMFEPFTQADSSTTRLYGGTGLGLAISHQLVELMGGEIGAASEPDAGSTFWFEVSLPRAEVAAARPASPERRARAADPAAPAPLVLLAEDSPVNRSVAAHMLERCGVRTDVAANGREALAALEQCDYDAVLMDCQMPELDGYEATAQLRRREQALGRHTPVIAMTAHALSGDRERCLAAGMDDYLVKPIRSEDLAEMLERWIPAFTSPLAPARS